jgi:hypothetical protein
MQYIVDNTKYSLSYKDLRDRHIDMVALSDSDFTKILPEAIHLACIICWFKEIPSSECLSDKGIIHELTHLLQYGSNDPDYDVKAIRELFNTQLKLA